MWKTRFSVYYNEGVYAPRAKKFGVAIHGYTLNYHSDKKYFYYTSLAFIEGDEKSKKRFINDLKKEKRIHKMEVHDDLFICVIKETETKEKKMGTSLFYNPLLIQLKPFIIHSDGMEEIELASFDRKYLEKILALADKEYNMEFGYIKNEKIDNLGVIGAFPKMTKKQRTSIEFAIKNGYYEYPRKIDVKKLAKRSKLSFSTFQEHLRRAENKIIPFVIGKIK